MKRFLFALGLVLLLAGGVPTAHAGIIVVKTPPPVVKIEIRPKAPFTRAVWIPGHWKWTGRKFVWIKGRWVKARRGFVYMPGHWKRVSTGWVWVDGHWRKA